MSAGGGYENAPATKMLATVCCCCGTALLDSVSVELGIGPTCRKKHGFNVQVPEEARKEANEIVHAIACAGGGLMVAQSCARLRELGFEKLAGVLEKRACPVRITEDAGRLLVQSPYSETATYLFRGVPGRRWIPTDKVNSFPVECRRQLFSALVQAYEGLVAMGPKGPFLLAAPAPANDTTEVA